MIALLLRPYLGVFVYLDARGDGMHERSAERAAAAEQAAATYIREVAAALSPAEELTRLARLRDLGVLMTSSPSRSRGPSPGADARGPLDEHVDRTRGGAVQDVVIGLLAVLVGLTLCFQGATPRSAWLSRCGMPSPGSWSERVSSRR